MEQKIIVAYVGVSTIEQDYIIQKNAIQNVFPNDKIIYFEEKLSGKSMDRPELEKMIDYVRKGDTVVVFALSRISRNARDMLNLLQKLDEKQVKFRSLSDNFDFNSALGKLMLSMIAGIAEYELDLIRYRQRVGIAEAKQNGKYLGRKRVKKPQNFDLCLEKYKNSTPVQKYTIREFSEETKLTKSTLMNFLKIEKEKWKEENQLKLRNQIENEKRQIMEETNQ
jgi:DNA invertase Pin-like site-specific DNA recombinase